MRSHDLQPLERPGLASLGDLEAEPTRASLRAPEAVSREFDRWAPRFRRPDYQWPADPLPTWSRVWEYPYVYHRLSTWQTAQPPTARPCAVGVGSGVTFFPFAVAQPGPEVIATDIDPVAERDLGRAISCVGVQPGTLSFRLAQAARLPFPDRGADAVCCISILEHVADPHQFIEEVYRTLRPRGSFLLTCDLDLRPDGARVSAGDRGGLPPWIRDRFASVHGDVEVRACDVLTGANGPYPFRAARRTPARLVAHFLKQWVVKPLLGRRPSAWPAPPPNVGV